MERIKKLILLLTVLSGSLPAVLNGQTWVDSIDVYARESFLPAEKYMWTWQRAALLRAMVVQYELRPEAEKQTYLDYVATAMKATEKRAHGKRPNAVASGHGMAFLQRVTGEPAYARAAQKVYRDFLKIMRLEGGGVSHKTSSPELWDDTIFMIGVFLLEMFRATGEERYLDDFMEEFRIHREKLLEPEWGLWVHGWDGNDKNHCALCGQRNWPDDKTRRSAEIWGRGNGWVVVTLADAVQAVPAQHPYHAELAGYILEMIDHLPELQDPETGHWFQLPVKPGLEGNYIESSSTAMFGYGITTALKLGLVEGRQWERSAEAAYLGLRKHSVTEPGNGYLTCSNVCKGTCIGDEAYYLGRKSVEGKPFGLAMLIIFGLEYEYYSGRRSLQK